MQTVKIRKIIKTDNAKLEAIIKSVLTELNCNIPGTAYYDKETEAMFEAYQNEKTAYFVAELNGEIVGGCGIGTLENFICELQKMYILPDARKHKIGFKLLQKCIDFAKEKDYDSIYLETFPQMKAAIALYQKNGFQKTPNAIGNTCHYSCNVWLLKPLKRSLFTLKNEFLNSLENTYSKEESEYYFNLLANHYLHLSRVDIALNPNTIVYEKDLNLFYDALKKLKNQEPIQYILGETEFYHTVFNVNKNVLIPRPETEELVDWIIQDAKNHPSEISILDIGTGSGCIAISLAKNLHANVKALDISKKALEVVKKNAIFNEVTIDLLEENILDSTLLFQNKLDIIVSNPPYVREMEKQQMHQNVLENEPHLALFVSDKNPLLFYTKIANFAKKNLDKNGKLYFEINEYLGNETVKMLQNKGFKNIILKKDLFGKDRMIRCEL